MMVEKILVPSDTVIPVCVNVNGAKNMGCPDWLRMEILPNQLYKGSNDISVMSLSKLEKG